MKSKKPQHYSRFTDKGPSIAGRVIRTKHSLSRKPVFEKGNAVWLSELPSVNKKYNNTIHSSTKMTPFQASEKSNEKLVHSNLKDNREVRKPKFNLGQLVRTSVIRSVFSKEVSTNWGYKLYTITEVVHDTISSYRINYLAEGYNKNLLRSTNLTLEGNNHVMKKLNLIQ